MRKVKGTDTLKKNPLSFQLNLEKFAKASSESKEMHVAERESVTFFRDGMRRLWKNKVAVVSGFLILLVILAVVIIPMVYPYTYDQMFCVQQKGVIPDETYKNLAPFEYSVTEQMKIDNGEDVFPHILGTDSQSHDYLSEWFMEQEFLLRLACLHLLLFLLSVLFMVRFPAILVAK